MSKADLGFISESEGEEQTQCELPKLPFSLHIYS